MGTSAPAVREHDAPTEEPYQPPKALPAPDRKHWVTPAKQPVREPVPVRRKSDRGTERV